MRQSIIAVVMLGLCCGAAAQGEPASPTTAPESAAATVPTAPVATPSTEITEPKPEAVPAPATPAPQPEAGPTPASGEPEATPAQPAADIELKSDADRVNYSLGFELGQDLKGVGIELAPEALMKGVEDAISGGKPRIRAMGRRAVLAQIREKRAEENLAEAHAFLAANAGKDGVVKLPSGLQYKEIRAGEGKRPGPDDTVTVNYRGTLSDGTEFDSSYARGRPSTFPVKKVIRGWAEAMQLMKEGAKWELFIPPELAYGKSGREPRIPPNSVLVFEVELIAVK